ncbi:condensation domain-containing protein, partial [Flavobacterium sp. LS1R47]
MNIISIIDDFKKNNSMLWVEDNGIKLFVSEDFKSDELKKTITEFKTEIFNILVFNGIYSKIDFLNKLIFKTDTQESILSFAQERLWFIEQYEEGTNAYHMPFLYELDKETDKEGLKYALQQIVSRHEVLRSTIEPRKDEGHGMQIVHNSPLFIEEIIVDETDDYNSLLNETINRPFNLNTEYPIRVVFYTIKSSSEVLQSKTLLLITIHHIASDGWSLEIFESELFDYYEAYVKKDIDFSLPALDIQYKDYAQWQRSYLTGSVLEDQLSYWKGKLSGYELLEFPTDYARPATIDYKGEDYDFKINSKITERLRALAQQEGLTLNNVMLSSINIMLGKYTGQNDIVIGTLDANRQQIQTEKLIGFFINTQANRTILNNSQNFVELIQEVQRDQIEAQLNQDLPFEKIVNDLGIDRDASRHPIFQILFEMDSFGKEEKKSEEQKKYLKPYNADEAYINARFDIVISINNHGDEMEGEINFANSLFNKETITRFSKHYLHLLDELTQA